MGQADEPRERYRENVIYLLKHLSHAAIAEQKHLQCAILCPNTTPPRLLIQRLKKCEDTMRVANEMMSQLDEALGESSQDKGAWQSVLIGVNSIDLITNSSELHSACQTVW